MLQISYIRQNTDLVKEKLAVKNITDLSVVDKLLETDEQVRKLKTETEALQAGINAASKEIGMLMGKGEKEAAENKKQEVAANKTSLQNNWPTPKNNCTMNWFYYQTCRTHLYQKEKHPKRMKR